MDAIKEFNKYIKNYDLKVKPIMGKYHHTFRVMNYASDIAKSLKLSEEEIEVAKLTGLLHDISRFKQYTEYHTYHDSKSFDHGDMAYTILKTDNFIDKFTNVEDYKQIILFAVKNHNKKTIEKGTEQQIKFAKIVRDADKLDILLEQCNTITENNLKLKEALIENLYKKSLCNNNEIKNDVDAIIRSLSFIFDLNFKYSFEFIINNKIIENKCNLLDIYLQDPKIKEIEEYLINYVKGEIEC